MITSDGAEAAYLRHSQKREADRLALAMWWAGYSEPDAVQELRTHLACVAQRGKFKVHCGTLASEMLTDALDELEARYEVTMDQVTTASLGGLERNESRSSIDMAAATLGASADPMLPVELVREAIREAIRQHNSTEALWHRHQAEVSRLATYDVELAA
jgi:hypothetical protein